MRLVLLLCCLATTGLVQRAFDLEGHRGYRGLMPENTIPTFLKALDLGISTLEMDVVISKDNPVSVSHESRMNAAFSISPDGKPVTKKEQATLVLYQMNYADIKRYDVGANDNPAYLARRHGTIEGVGHRWNNY